MKTSDNDKTPIVFSGDQNIKSKTITAIPSKGVYLTYADVLNDRPLDDSNFQFVNKKERFYLLNKATNSEELNYYGLSDGKIFYLNVSKYASAKYYAKTEIIGGKYYIEDVVYNANNAIAMGAMFGLIGVAIASSAGNSSSVPMLIDCYSGQPSFLSNNEMKAMLMPYPTLLKDFKNSKKRGEDIKAILKRYYQEAVVQY
ncbi:DUF6563 family protein [Flavobacterium sp. ZS1P14]|uniref:DUF6563 family protein n=1 Tax=Flavobacterium sp. ZS1P14 TaxID=3401729 RepID=UPI003AAE1551